MLNSLCANRHQGEIHWLHAAENGAVHAFASEVAAIAERMPNLSRHVWYREPGADDVVGHDYHSRGLMDLRPLRSTLHHPQMHYYFCGPQPFMQFVAQQLLAMDVAAERIHYECFGPHKVL